MSGGWKGPLHWLPRRTEIERITQIVESVAEPSRLPTVLEIGAGTGLLSLLLAQTNRLIVTAMNPSSKSLLNAEGNSNNPIYSHPNLELLLGNVKASSLLFKDSPPDMVVCAWMPQYDDFTNEIASIGAQVILYIYPNDPYHIESIVEKNGVLVAERFRPRKGYKRAYTWSGCSMDDVHTWWDFARSVSFPDKGTNGIDFFGNNIFDVHLRCEINKTILEDNKTKDKLPWEQTDLKMVLDLSEEPYRVVSAFASKEKAEQFGDPASGTYEKNLEDPERMAILQAGLERLLQVEPIKYHS